MKTFAAALIALFVCNTPVLAQTGILTPAPEAEHPAPGELPQGAAIQVGPGMDIMTDRACQLAVARALAVHTLVPVPVESKDPKCAEWMQKALKFQNQSP